MIFAYLKLLCRNCLAALREITKYLIFVLCFIALETYKGRRCTQTLYYCC
jgi:hypothetical protein